MTSFNGTTIRAHLAKKGISTSNGAEAAARGGYLRVVTASKPHALGTLKLRHGKGMKRDCSYVGVRKTYKISLRGLALYGGPKEEVDAYRLTAHALKVLVGEIKERRKRGRKVPKVVVRVDKARGVIKVEKAKTERIIKQNEREALSPIALRPTKRQEIKAS
jgi:hypothetical protein